MRMQHNRCAQSVILGIDPGLQKTGWAVITSQSNQLSFVACGTIRPATKVPIAQRLGQLNHALQEVICSYAPQEAALEETFVNQNPASTLKLGQARGAILLSLALGGLPVAEYAPNRVKKALTGVGRAGKDQVGMMVSTLLPFARAEIEAAGEDARDALAVAICHAHYSAIEPVV